MTDPIPTKFEESDWAWVEALVIRTGLSRSEIIRRSVRLLATEAAKRPDWNWVEATAQPLPRPEDHLAATLSTLRADEMVHFAAHAEQAMKTSNHSVKTALEVIRRSRDLEKEKKLMAEELKKKQGESQDPPE